MDRSGIRTVGPLSRTPSPSVRSRLPARPFRPGAGVRPVCRRGLHISKTWTKRPRPEKSRAGEPPAFTQSPPLSGPEEVPRPDWDTEVRSTTTPQTSNDRCARRLSDGVAVTARGRLDGLLSLDRGFPPQHCGRGGKLQRVFWHALAHDVVVSSQSYSASSQANQQMHLHHVHTTAAAGQRAGERHITAGETEQSPAPARTPPRRTPAPEAGPARKRRSLPSSRSALLSGESPHADDSTSAVHRLKTLHQCGWRG
jgi:hypothetical protein